MVVVYRYLTVPTVLMASSSNQRHLSFSQGECQIQHWRPSLPEPGWGSSHQDWTVQHPEITHDGRAGEAGTHEEPGLPQRRPHKVNTAKSRFNNDLIHFFIFYSSVSGFLALIKPKSMNGKPINLRRQWAIFFLGFNILRVPWTFHHWAIILWRSSQLHRRRIYRERYEYNGQEFMI